MSEHAAITLLRHQCQLHFAGGTYLHIPSQGATAIADILLSVLGQAETIRLAFQVGKLAPAPGRSEHVGNLTWYLLTDKALLDIKVAVTLGQRGTTSIARARRRLLPTLRWCEIEETQPPLRNETSCKITLAFAEEEPFSIDSTAITESASTPTGDQLRTAREFAAQLLQ